jgi:hypothetical protein
MLFDIQSDKFARTIKSMAFKGLSIICLVFPNLQLECAIVAGVAEPLDFKQ